MHLPYFISRTDLKLHFWVEVHLIQSLMDLVYCPFFMYCSFNVTIYYSKNMPFWFWQFLIIILCSLSVSFEVKSAKFALSFIDTKSILSCLLQFTYYSSILSSYFISITICVVCTPWDWNCSHYNSMTIASHL